MSPTQIAVLAMIGALFLILIGVGISDWRAARRAPLTGHRCNPGQCALCDTFGMWHTGD